MAALPDHVLGMFDNEMVQILADVAAREATERQGFLSSPRPRSAHRQDVHRPSD